MNFTTFRIGRSPNSDLHIDHPEVSRRQVEITVTLDGRYYLVDCGSSSGTFQHDGKDWVRLTQGYVEPETQLAFGQQRFRLRELLKRLPAAGARRQQPVAEPVSVRPRRKVETGEVEFARKESGK